MRQQLERDPTVRPPQWVLDEPVPDEFTRWVTAAFWSLSTERQVGMALGHVPDSAIRAWAEREGVVAGNMALVTAVIRSLDCEYLEHATRRAKLAAKRKESP